jgi:hypothetical protein
MKPWNISLRKRKEYFKILYYEQALMAKIGRAVSQPTEELLEKERLVGIKGLLNIPTEFEYSYFLKKIQNIQRFAGSTQIPFEVVAVGIDLISRGSREPDKRAEAKRIAKLAYLNKFIRQMESQFEQVLNTTFPSAFELPIHDFTPLHEN